jgi:GNAT superfamily N-acetyltransferase
LPVVIVRQARVDDGGAVGEAHAEAWRIGFADLFEPGFLGEAVRDRRERWVSWLAGGLPGGTQVLVAEVDRQVVGFVHIGRRDADADVGEVFALYVHPDHWGTGAARSLLDEAVQRLRADGLVRVVLWTHVGAARARRFYEDQGWSATGRTARSDLGAGRPSPLVEYARSTHG